MKKRVPLIITVCAFSTLSITAQTISAKIAALPGVYKHKRPCTNCTGVENTLILYCKQPCLSGNYSLREAYINSINGDHVAENTGKWSIADTAAGLDESSIIIALTETATPGKTTFYIAKDGALEQLDKNKHAIEAPFNLILKKQ